MLRENEIEKVPSEQLDMITDVLVSEVSNSEASVEEVHYVSGNESSNDSDKELSIIVTNRFFESY